MDLFGLHKRALDPPTEFFHFLLPRLGAFAAAILVLMSSMSCQEDRPRGSTDQILRVSFPRIELERNERIVGLEIIVTYGDVKALDNIPPDWSINLEVDPAWRSRISGGTHHGAGALTSPSQLDAFLAIRPWPDKNYKLDVQATLHTTVDFERTKARSFKINDLVLKKIK